MSAFSLTPRQADCLRFIAGYSQAHRGVSPSCSEIAVGIGWSPKSKGAVTELLDDLQSEGAIRRLPARARAIEVVAPVAVPMIGREPLMSVPFHAQGNSR